MATERAADTDDASYGELLGEYFSVVADVGRLLDEFGRPRAEETERYDRLRARKAALRARLADAEPEEDRVDYRALLDEAGPSE